MALHWTRNAVLVVAIKKTCRVSVHFSHKPLRTLTQHPVALQLATRERCDNCGSWFQPRHERQAQGEASAIWGFSVPVHFSDKPLSPLSQRPVALTATGFALSHWFTALPWQQGGEDVNCSIEIWRRISGLRGEACLHLAKDKACNSEQEQCLRAQSFFLKIPRNPSRWSSSFRILR